VLAENRQLYNEVQDLKGRFLFLVLQGPNTQRVTKHFAYPRKETCVNITVV
jgi:hypothetical protein